MPGTFQVEFSFERQPEVVQIDDKGSLIRGEREIVRGSIGLPLGDLLMAINYTTDFQKGVENRLIDPVGSNTIGVEGLYRWSEWGLSLAYNRTAFDNNAGSELEGNFILLGLSYNYGSFSASTAEPQHKFENNY